MSSEFYAIQAAPTSNSDWFWVGFSSRREKYYASKHFSSELIFPNMELAQQHAFSFLKPIREMEYDDGVREVWATRVVGVSLVVHSDGFIIQYDR
jgi:hypothetical protein